VKRQRSCLLPTLSVATLLLTAAVLHAQSTASAQDELAARRRLAQLLENPVANLVNVPLQNNFDFGIGSAQAMRYTLNIQPVIPFTLSADWNFIIRTIVPIIYAESPTPGGKNTFGLGDITQSFSSRRKSWLVA
jgi:hypothetical protein